jgi:hypothetical protein
VKFKDKYKDPSTAILERVFRELGNEFSLDTSHNGKVVSVT